MKWDVIIGHMSSCRESSPHHCPHLTIRGYLKAGKAAESERVRTTPSPLGGVNRQRSINFCTRPQRPVSASHLPIHAVPLDPRTKISISFAIMAGIVPIANSLEDIYTPDALPSQEKRWKHLLSTFESTYSHPATFVSRSPGRVNIIGEHIDYSLYSVFPMAITADCLLAVSVPSTPAPASSTTFKLRLANVDGERFPTHEVEIPYGDVEIDSKVHEWTNYFKCGLRGALQLLKKTRGEDFRPVGMDVLMDGAVPSGGGLSSSAAFVSASALAVMVANGEKEIDKTALTELAIVSERAVGVNSGG